MSVRCYIIGHGKLTQECCQHLLGAGVDIRGVQTRHNELANWAASHQLPVFTNSDELLAAFSEAPAEYLFSIINPDKVPSALLNAPLRAAFNYHDGPLPLYAGLHVTSWAVMNQEATHGVTWHLMNDQFDAGDVVLQREFPLDVDETAFTLSLKCNAEALALFKLLTEQLRNDSWVAQPQATANGSVYRRYQRPAAAGLIDWGMAAERIDAMVRGLTYATDPNPLGLPKFVLGERHLLLCQSQVVSTSQGLPPGQIDSVDDASLVVTTATGALRLLEVRTLDGALITAAELIAQHDLKVGSQLPIPTPAEREQLTALDAQWVRQERFWSRALARCLPLNPFAHLQLDDTPRPAEQRAPRFFPLDASLLAQFEQDADGSEGARERLIALYYCFLSRLTRSAELPVTGSIGVLEPWVNEPWGSLLQPYRPFDCPLDHEQPLTQNLHAAATAFADLDDRVGLLQDLTVRTPGLGKEQPKVLVSRADYAAASVPALSIVLHSAGQGSGFAVDTHWLAAAHCEQHVDMFSAFLRGAIDHPERALAACGYVNEADEQRVLRQWNTTTSDLSTQACIQTQIEHQAGLRPDATALVYREQSLTYQQLSEQARTIAAALLRDGVGADSMIGIYLPRSIEMVVAMVAVQYAGAAYVPLDPAYPADRVDFMITDAGLEHILTDTRGSQVLAAHPAKLWHIDLHSNDLHSNGSEPALDAPVSSASDDLAYAIYTSGSTGNPKGVMIEHGNLINFLHAMDQVLEFDGTPGVWLAVTSMSFDISVLELLWTLARGFKVVIQEDALAARHMTSLQHAEQPMDFSLFYFSSDAGDDGTQNRYRLLLDGARFADAHDFSAIWTPERHFHLFGGLYPNPSVTSAAVAAVTSRIAIRAGSIVLPLHHPVRVAEEWSVVDNLSNGRVGFSFASGWHANDFALRPENYAERKQLMYDGIETVLKLWRGETVEMLNGEGNPFDARVFPPPVQQQPPIWITAAGNVETFQAAGASGQNLLTNLLGQTVADLTEKISAYQRARTEAGFAEPGTVSVMVHTFIGEDVEAVRAVVKEPFCHYLKTSFDLVKIAPWAFPAFSQPSKKDAQDQSLDTTSFTDEDLDALIEHAFDRYFETAGLFGTPESVLPLVDELKGAGVTEVACLVDFGVPEQSVLDSLEHLNALRVAALPATGSGLADDTADYSIAAQLAQHQVTHFQCTPSMARALWTDSHTRDQFKGLQHMLLGGEALPADLARLVVDSIDGQLTNVYGPTETTIWSTAGKIASVSGVPDIGRPLANTQIYILDADQQPVPPGVPGELHIAGAGVVRGYHNRDDLTGQKFVPNPFAETGERMYRTGDLASWSDAGTLRFHGRLDHQIKLRGYRIELGEIETHIGALDGVGECAVIAHGDHNDSAQLVAYVVAGPSDSHAAAVASWEGLWSDAYATSDAATEVDTLNTAGWLDSISGEQHDADEMAEWASMASERILALAPRRVLEIGCGTGMLLYQIAPHCERYLGTDVSEVGLAGIRSQLANQQLHQVELQRCAADALATLPAETFDVIVLNSVAQYFPSASYFADVIRGAMDRLEPGGHLFLGDIRSKAAAPLLYQAIEWHRQEAGDTAAGLLDKTLQRADSEPELLCDPDFFVALGQSLPAVAALQIQLKGERAHNEMSMFRYDVVLRKQTLGGAPAAQTIATHIDLRSEPTLPTLDAFCERLRDAEKPVRVTGIPNARLWAQANLAQRLQEDAAADPTNLLPAVSEMVDGGAFDPAVLLEQLLPLRGQLSWDQEHGVEYMTLILSKDVDDTDAGWQSVQDAPGDPLALSRFCNAPRQRNASDQLKLMIRSHLGARLPDFMVPDEVIVLDAMPLTPNGKIDRKRLPAPVAAGTESTAYVAPESGLEAQIAEIFSAMLARPNIGSHDNFFDIGANSLLIVQANSRLSRLLGRKVPLVSMYRYPTVASLANSLADPDSKGPDLPAKAVNRAQRRKQARAGRRRRSAG
ncbi:MAG: MupA/Atu3671 family FMN-dependent luciferase-like monooxygenase [Pseudomonadales bacterium]